jgi:hypothetical protein
MKFSEETHFFFRPVGCCPTTGHFLFLVQKNDYVRITIRVWGIGFSPHDVKENCYGLE